MARDRDHAAVAARMRAQGQALLDAWADYEAKAQALADLEPCPSIWPESLAMDAPVQCQLLEGHIQRARLAHAQEGHRHRHRVLGSSATVEWD